MQKLKIAYFGSPSFSATFLEKIINDKDLPVEICLVVTQPDMPVGRKQIITPTPVKLLAEQYRLPIIYSTELLNSNDQLSMIKSQSIINDSMINQKSAKIEQLKIENWKLKIKECDLALVYAYGEILPKEFLSLPKFGFWNIHPSLLPKYRGASPIAYPLILGNKKTGVSLIQMDEKMDHGPILAQEELEINPEDTRPDLENKLTNLAYEIFKKLISTNFNQFQLISTHPQNHNEATYTSILKKSDGFIPLSVIKKMLLNEKITIKELPEFIRTYQIKYQQPIPLILNTNYLLLNLFRGLSPWPGLWTLLRSDSIGTTEGQAHSVFNRRLKILKMELKDSNFIITKVQLENKNPVDFKTFNTAYKLLP